MNVLCQRHSRGQPNLKHARGRSPGNAVSAGFGGVQHELLQTLGRFDPLVNVVVLGIFWFRYNLVYARGRSPAEYRHASRMYY